MNSNYYSVIFQKNPSRVRVAQKIPSSIWVAGTRWGLVLAWAIIFHQTLLGPNVHWKHMAEGCRFPSVLKTSGTGLCTGSGKWAGHQKWALSVFIIVFFPLKSKAQMWEIGPNKVIAWSRSQRFSLNKHFIRSYWDKFSRKLCNIVCWSLLTFGDTHYTADQNQIAKRPFVTSALYVNIVIHLLCCRQLTLVIVISHHSPQMILLQPGIDLARRHAIRHTNSRPYIISPRS